MVGQMTFAEIENELTEIRSARLDIIKSREVQGSQGGRQTTKHAMISLTYLNEREKQLIGMLSRMNEDGTRKGIRPRYGVLRG